MFLIIQSVKEASR